MTKGVDILWSGKMNEYDIEINTLYKQMICLEKTKMHLKMAVLNS